MDPSQGPDHDEPPSLEEKLFILKQIFRVEVIDYLLKCLLLHAVMCQ